MSTLTNEYKSYFQQLSNFKCKTVAMCIHLKSTVSRVDMKPKESKLRGVLFEGTRPFPDFSFSISDSLW